MVAARRATATNASRSDETNAKISVHEARFGDPIRDPRAVSLLASLFMDYLFRFANSIQRQLPTRIMVFVILGIVIIGAGGFGREVRDWLLQSQDIIGPHTTTRVLGFLDDGTPDPERLTRIAAVHLGPVSSLRELDAMYYVAVGDPRTRRQIVQRCEGLGATPGPALVHPSVVR